MTEVYLDQESSLNAPAHQESHTGEASTDAPSTWPAVERCDWVFSGTPPRANVTTYGRTTPAAMRAPRRRM